MGQITHTADSKTGRLRQIVSAATLRAVLDESGDDYSRPSHFGPHDDQEGSS